MSKKVSGSLYFYQGQRLVTVKQAERHCLILRGNKLPIAQFGGAGSSQKSMLATDGKESIFSAKSAEAHETLSFTVYGYGSTLPSSLTLLGFNGEFFNAPHSSYLLGNGHRSFSPVIMRFLSPDSLSPFLAGGLNTYAYCGNDPINAVDPSGKTKLMITRTIRRQPVNTVIKVGPETQVPNRTALITDQDGSFFTKTWQPEPTIQKQMVRVVRSDGTRRGMKGYVREGDFGAFKDTNKKMAELMSAPAPLTETDTNNLERLQDERNSYLHEGARLMKAARRDLGISVTMAIVRDDGKPS